MFLLSSVSVGTEMMFCVNGCTAVIDTGSSYITGPASSVSLLMRTIGAQLDESGVSICMSNMDSKQNETNKQKNNLSSPSCAVQQYQVNCDAVKMLPSVTFHLGGQEYSLTQEDYILWVNRKMITESFKYKNLLINLLKVRFQLVSTPHKHNFDLLVLDFNFI